jgi:Fe-S-cluster containining protein
MSARCNQCGNCCENIPMNTTKKAIRALLRTGKLKTKRGLADATFIMKHWHFAGWMEVYNGLPKPGQRVYSCDMFDTETRLCTAHKDRPPVCSLYPWYGKKPEAWMLAPVPAESAKLRSCSYWFDIPKKDRPEWATPVRLRRA